MPKYMLIESAEGEITHKIFDTLEKAQEAMEKRAQFVCDFNLGAYVEDGNAFVGEMAVSVIDGKNHDNYSWKIVEITSEERPISISEMAAEEIVAELTPEQKDTVYRKLWSDYVRADVISYATENIEEELDDEAVNDVVESYVYRGDYDCNLSYWSNIENLIERYKRSITHEAKASGLVRV